MIMNNKGTNKSFIVTNTANMHLFNSEYVLPTIK